MQLSILATIIINYKAGYLQADIFLSRITYCIIAAWITRQTLYCNNEILGPTKEHNLIP